MLPRRATPRQQRGQAGEPKEPHHLLFVAGAQAALQRNFLTSQAWCLRLVALKREKPMHKTFIYTSSSQLGSIKQHTTNMCQAITKTMSRVRGHGGPSYTALNSAAPIVVQRTRVWKYITLTMYRSLNRSSLEIRVHKFYCSYFWFKEMKPIAGLPRLSINVSILI